MSAQKNITQVIGRTPLVYLNRLAADTGTHVACKLEFNNPCASVKDRIGLAMIEAAEKDDRLKPGGTIVEATSGNTGIALAWIGAARGYRVILTMPDTMSMERRQLLCALGAELVLTPGREGMKGAVTKAEQLAEQGENAVLMRQFENPANPDIHYRTTGPEIWEATEGKIDVFVAGIGTGGTITGAGHFLKEKNPDIQVIGVEPEDSSVLSGGKPGPHKIQGIGAGFIPAVLDRGVLDEVIKMSAANAADTAGKLAREEGIFGGISSGSNVSAALEAAARPGNRGKVVVTVACDTGERYLSTDLFK